MTSSSSENDNRNKFQTNKQIWGKKNSIFHNLFQKINYLHIKHFFEQKKTWIWSIIIIQAGSWISTSDVFERIYKTINILFRVTPVRIAHTGSLWKSFMAILGHVMDRIFLNYPWSQMLRLWTHKTCSSILQPNSKCSIFTIWCYVAKASLVIKWSHGTFSKLCHFFLSLITILA